MRNGYVDTGMFSVVARENADRMHREAAEKAFRTKYIEMKLWSTNNVEETGKPVRRNNAASNTKSPSTQRVIEMSV